MQERLDRHLGVLAARLLGALEQDPGRELVDHVLLAADRGQVEQVDQRVAELVEEDEHHGRAGEARRLLGQPLDRVGRPRRGRRRQDQGERQGEPPGLPAHAYQPVMELRIGT